LGHRHRNSGDNTTYFSHFGRSVKAEQIRRAALKGEKKGAQPFGWAPRRE
jgi:hypothetical protein